MKDYLLIRRGLLKSTAAFAVICVLPLGLLAADLKPQAKPNIILIMTDDQGYGDLGRHKNPVLKTPNMDRLCDESVRFTDFCVSPSCAPTRCALMTGMHEFKSGVSHTIFGRERMNLKSVTMADLLKSAGYTTGIFGKWHLGASGGYRPEKRGFDHSLTAVGDSQNSHFDPVLLRNGEREKMKGYRTDILFREAQNFIEVNKDRPFFCYIPTYSPHGPLKAPPEYIDRYKGTASRMEVAFFAMIANIDDNIGKLMAKLKSLDLDEKTLVIFMNDNGGTAGVDLWNADMRGCKGTSWFGGTRAMSFWRWPNVLQPGTVDELTGHVDILPTLTELAGIKVDPQQQEKLDGISLVPLLKSSKAAWPDRKLFTHMGRWPDRTAKDHKYSQCAVRWQQYQLVRSDTCDDKHCKGECRIFRRTMTGASKIAYSSKKGQFHYAVTNPGEWSLYDVKKDPSQKENLEKKHPEIVEKLAAAYDRWWGDVSTCVD